MENKPESSLVVYLGKALHGTPHFCVEDRWPRHFENSNSQASTDIPFKAWRYNSLSREWRINMLNKKKSMKVLSIMTITSQYVVPFRTIKSARSDLSNFATNYRAINCVGIVVQ